MHCFRWVFRLTKPKLEVHGELIAFDKDRVAVSRVAGVEWAMWDLNGDIKTGNVQGRQNSSAPPHWSEPRFHFKGLAVRSVLLAGDKLVLGLGGVPDSEGDSKGELRLYSTKDGSLLGQVALDSGIIQAGMAAAHGELYVTCADGSVRCFGK